MFGTMARAMGTSPGAPGMQNVFCMSITSSAVLRRVEAGEPVHVAAARDHALDDVRPDGNLVHPP